MIFSIYKGDIQMNEPNKNKQHEHVLEILNFVGAYHEKVHIRLSSGMHTDTYIDPDMLYEDPAATMHIAEMIASRFPRDSFDTVITPPGAATILGAFVAYNLEARSRKKTKVTRVATVQQINNSKITIWNLFYKRKEVKKIWYVQDKDASGIRDKRVLVVDDVHTTGKTLQVTIQAARALSPRAISTAVILDRGNQREDTHKLIRGVSCTALATIHTELWQPHNCPLCKNGALIHQSLGHPRG
jgi:orotate phosphoribosyltransferase